MRAVATWLFVAALLVAGRPARAAATPDPRDIANGSIIPCEGYCDQPYVVITQEGKWLCTMTTGRGKEGMPGQHIVSLLSADEGRTWSKPVAIEPASGPEASWATPLVTDFGRVYVFYDYNGDRVNSAPGLERRNARKPPRADMLGWYCYRYSDDGGKSWSAERYRLPVRQTAVDLANNWHGTVQIFWGVSKPIRCDHGRSAIFAFTKLGKYLLDQGEGWFFRSDNILTERDAAKLEWKMLPDGDHGVRNEAFGSVQEEYNLVELSEGTLYCINRTTLGHPGCSVSHDGGHTWSTPAAPTYASGHVIKHPRACPRLFRCGNGNFLLWYHNNGGKDYGDRNPAWIAGGVERNGTIVWSEPEILLYDKDRNIRMSYPDLIEQNGKYFVTETQKDVARVHPIDVGLLQRLWEQGTNQQVAAKPVLELQGAAARAVSKPLAKLPSLREGKGFSLELAVQFTSLQAGQVLLDNRDAQGRGFAVTTTSRQTLQLELNDGTHHSVWDCDPALLATGKQQHVAINVDAGAKLVMFVVNGRLCDGGSQRVFGWGRIDPQLTDINGTGVLKIAPSLAGRIELLRVYDRCLRNSEAVGNYRANAVESGRASK